MKFTTVSKLARFSVLALAAVTAGCSTTRHEQQVDFNGMWFVTEYDEIKRPDENAPPYTDGALHRFTNYKKHFDPVDESAVNYCNPIGMPWAMLARARDYPREVYQTEDRMLVFFEYMDEYRTIYLDRTEVPDNWIGSSMGYSLGSWEGDELIVKTTGYSESTEASMLQRSDEAKTIERWRRYNHPKWGDVIEVDIEVIDPLIYKEPRHGRALWRIGAPDTVINTYDCPASLWENYVSDRLDEVREK